MQTLIRPFQLFFETEVASGAHVTALVASLVLAAPDRLGVRRVYGIIGLAVWLATRTSGVRATLASVLAVLAARRIDAAAFAGAASGLVDRFRVGLQTGQAVPTAAVLEREVWP